MRAACDTRQADGAEKKRVCNDKRQFTQQFTGEVSIKIVLAVRYGDEGAENWETSMELSRLKRTT